MAETNGSGRLIESRREQARRDLEPTRTRGPKPFISAEETAQFKRSPSLRDPSSVIIPIGYSPTILLRNRSWPDIVDNELSRRLRRYGNLIAERTARKESVEAKSMFASTIYPTGFQVRSRQKLTGLVDGFKNICERWSLNDLEIARLLHLEEEIGLCALILSGQVPPMTGDLKDRMALVIGISVGLGDLFDDNKNAEIRWLSSARDDLNGVNPIEYMLKGEFTNLKEVNELVEAARGLQ